MDAAAVVVIDGANVVGSRPDGWWRDRPAAAARLHARLLAATPIAPTVLLVLEGKARAGVPEDRTGAIGVVHAAREGDDTIVEEVRAVIDEGRVATVVTADRGLTERVQRLGAEVHGPTWLLDHIDP